jgi:2'-5' RNA ligase
MRLFVGLPIPNEIRHRIGEYIDLQRHYAPRARWVSQESLHVTLKFIGQFPEQRLEQLKQALSSLSGQAFEVTFEDVGFFTPRSPRVFWIGVHGGHELAALAKAVDEETTALGVAREERNYSPHLTLARVGSGRPAGSRADRNKPTMHELKAQVEGRRAPVFGTMRATEFILYQSKTLPQGAQYTKLAYFPLNS